MQEDGELQVNGYPKEVIESTIKKLDSDRIQWIIDPYSKEVSFRPRVTNKILLSHLRPQSL